MTNKATSAIVFVLSPAGFVMVVGAANEMVAALD
jgi:hypothetical protein